MRNLDTDLATGKLQSLINEGYTRLELQEIYGTTQHKFRELVVTKQIKFPKNTGKPAKRKRIDSLWSEGKKLALCGEWR